MSVTDCNSSLSGTARFRIVLVAMLLTIVGWNPRSDAATATMFSKSPCITQDEVDACTKLARQVSRDSTALRQLGSELEQLGRYDAAMDVYRIGVAAHPDHRDLLQGLIRSRSQARAKNMLAGNRQLDPQSVASAPAATPIAIATSAKKSIKPPAKQARASRVAPKPAVDPTSTGRYLALVIGNEQYSDFTRLKTPVADVHAVAALLGRDYGFTVTVLVNATRYQLVSALSQIRRQATAEDSVLIYYAGHGYLDETTSRGYWLPVDAEHDNLANWLSTSDITDVLAGLQARHALILADSCFSGTLLRSDATVAIDERQALLRKLSTRRSRGIMTSGGLEPVVDNGGGRHSVFAAALLAALSENRQILEGGRLFMQIRDHVAARAAQTPQYAPLRNAGHDGGDFIFIRATPKKKK